MNKELKVIENDLVPVYETSAGEKVVYGTELHTVLKVKSPYREWSARRLKDCDAVEGEDFDSVEISTLSGGTPKKEHIIKLDTAKEMAMLERNEKGKQVRRYFIQIEKKYDQFTNEGRRMSAELEANLSEFIEQQSLFNLRQLEFNDRVLTSMEFLVQGNVPEMKRVAAKPRLSEKKRKCGVASSWVCVKEQVLGNQTRALARELGCSQNEALGLLVRFWLWAANNADDEGHFKMVDREDIEDALCVGKNSSYSRGDAVDALLVTGLLQNADGFQASQWEYWQDMLLRYIKIKQNDAERKRSERSRKRMQAYTTSSI